MQYLYWGSIIVFVLIVLFGIRNWIRFVSNSFLSNGVKFTIGLIILSILFVAPAFVKDYAPEYYGYSIWALILYVAGIILYSRREKNKSEEG